MPDDGDRVHLLPEQVRRIQLDADVGGAGQLDELVHVCRVEHDILRVELEGDLHIMVTREAIGLAPELGCDAPLVVEHVERGRVPGIDDPVGPDASGLARWETRHRHDPVLPEPSGEADGAADVFRMLLADHRVGMKRVAVAVEPGDRDARALEDAEEVVARGIAHEDVVEGRDVDGGEESAGVDLDPGEAQVGDDLDRLR